MRPQYLKMDCCYNCKDREPGCHSGCLKFLSYALAYENQKETIKKNSSIDANYHNYVKMANKNMKKGKRK